MKIIINGVSVDLPSGGNSGGSSGGVSDIYSTEEVQVGYWIESDGIIWPLYRKMFFGTIPSVNTPTSIITYPSNYKAKTYQTFLERSDGFSHGTFSSPTNNYNTDTWIEDSTNSLMIAVGSGYSQLISGKTCTLILEYTKTTDEPVTDIPTGGLSSPSVKMVLITLLSSGWDVDKKQTVSVTGVKADESAQVIRPTPAIASQSAYYSAGILCVNQAENSLTFQANTIPTEDISVYVEIQEVG